MNKFNFNFIEVVLNNSCPLDCSYCFTENKGQFCNMPEKTLRKVFDLAIVSQEANPREFISIMFALKEPFVSYGMFKSCIENLPYSLIDNKIFITINTNGVLLTQDKIEWCRSRNIDLHISLDGPKDIHDSDRVFRGKNKEHLSSWDKIIEIINNNPNAPYLSFMTTLQKKNKGKYREIFDFMTRLPIKSWIYSVNKFEKWGEEDYKCLEEEIKAFVNTAESGDLQKLMISDTASNFTDNLITNGIKIFQNGDIQLLPPTIGDMAEEKYQTKMMIGNVHSGINFSYPLIKLSSKDYYFYSQLCSQECSLFSYCHRGNEIKAEVLQTGCYRWQHFNRMKNYIDCNKMTTEEYYEIVGAIPTYNAVINVTDECNLRCQYCFTTPNKSVIDLGTIKATVMYLVSSCDKFENFDKPIGLNFFGGEPMLYFDEIIKPTIEWVNSYAPKKYKYTFGMTTNGTLLTEEKLRWLYQNNVSLLLSIDGDRETQDDQRPTKNGGSSFDLLENKIPLILNYYPQITFRSTIRPHNVDKLFLNYLYARNHGFTHWFCCPNVYEEWTVDQAEELVKQLGLIGHLMMLDISNGYPPCEWHELFVSMARLYDNKTSKISYHHCGIGTASIGVTTNGDINGCQEHNTYQTKDIFYIGNVFTGIDVKRHKRLLINYREVEHPTCKERPNWCNNCPFYNDCGNNFCPSHNIGNTGHATNNTFISCAWKITTRVIAQSIINQLNIVQDENIIKYVEKIYSPEFNKDYRGW